MSPAFAGSPSAFLVYPQLALWARRISPASLARCTQGAENNRGAKEHARALRPFVMTFLKLLIIQTRAVLRLVRCNFPFALSV